MSNKDVCTKLQELIDAISDTEMAEYIPAITEAKNMLTPKSTSKKASPIAGQISLDEVLASYY